MTRGERLPDSPVPDSATLYSLTRLSSSHRALHIATACPVPSLEAPRKCFCRFHWNYECHGLTMFLSRRSWATKLLWLAFIGACMLTAFLTTNQVFGEYLERETVTRISVTRVKNLLFPTLTFCPKNPDAFNYSLVLQDLRAHLPALDESSVRDLLVFAIAGAGFDNMGDVVQAFSRADTARLAVLLRRWRGIRSLTDFYGTLFEEYGYRCEDFFNGCFYGSETVDCCRVLRPVFVMLRGRCFELRGWHQSDPDEVGKLSVYLNGLPSPLADPTGQQPQMVVYVSDAFPDVGTFPRFYLNFRQWNRMRFRLRRIEMQPNSGLCAPEARGAATCFVDDWALQQVVGRLNCSVFYMRAKAPGVSVCDPETLVHAYAQLVNPRPSHTCLLPCVRSDTSVDTFSAVEIGNGPVGERMPSFRLEASYTSLEFESYKEVLTTSPQGFLSQIGGQFELFLGVSLITIVQGCFSLVWLSYRRLKPHVLHTHLMQVAPVR